MKIPHNLWLAAIGISSTLISSCSLNRIAANTTAGVMVNASKTFNEESDLDWAEAAMPGNLKMIEGLLVSSPENTDLLGMLAQGYCSYGFAFLEDSEEPNKVERAKRFYQRGYHYGLRALPKSIQSTSASTLDSFENSLKDISKSDVPNLFWSAYCLGNWVNLNKANVAGIAELSRSELMMRKVLELDESFYYGGAHLFYGVYYGGRPKILGGNTKRAKEHFDKASAFSSGKLLVTKLFTAQYFAVPTQDEELFGSLLKEILAAPDDIMPGEALATQLSKRKAAKLLKNQKDLF